MELRSSRVLKRGKTDIENIDSSDEKKVSSSSDISNSGKKGASEVKIGVSVDNADEDSIKEGVNTDDKGLFFGSEVLDPIKDLVVSSQEGEIEEESVERVKVKEVNKSVSINSSETKKKSPDKFHASLVDSENVEKFDDDKETVDLILDDSTSLNDSDNADCGRRKRVLKKGKGKSLRKKRKVEPSKKNKIKHEYDTKNKESEGVNVVTCKRGRKRKNMDTLECNEDKKGKKMETKNERVLRSRSYSIVNFGIKNESNEKVKPKKKLQCRGRPRKVETKDENAPMPPRPKNKKQKRLGRPPKVKEETTPCSTIKRRGRPAKVRSENEILSVAVKPRGRPRKLPIKEKLSQGIMKIRRKSTMFKRKVKRHGQGQPPKIEARKVASHVIKMRNVKLMAVKKAENEVKSVNKITKIKKEDDENEEMILKSEGEGEKDEKGMDKKQRKQLLREKLVNVLVKAGWKIDRRPRQEKTYKDFVYIEPNNGRSHWSVTGAYAKLKKKIEEDHADSNELSAYIPIPNEEMSILFRYVDKELGYKKKKNRITLKKKNNNGSKRKRIQKPSKVKVKVKRNKPHSENGTLERRKPRLLARSSEKGPKQDNDNSSLYTSKRNLISWMIDSGVISSSSKVQYGKTRRQKKSKSTEGTLTNDGICCKCCNEVMGVSGFVVHAGGKQRLNRLFDNLYLESGISLRECLAESWKKEEELKKIKFNMVDVKGEDPNDDTCNICGDGGNLICCDSCPSTFHQICLDIQNFPIGDWNCIYCSCKFCGMVSNNAPEVDDSCDELPADILLCCLCEEKFHQSCLQEEAEDVNADSSELAFCGRKCLELFERLQTFLGVKHELKDGFSWTLLQRSDIGQDLTTRDVQLKVESNSKMAVAFSVMDECFVPIIDERSGTNIIHNVVYNCGSNFRRLNFAGFLTAILEKGDEFITAASIRIHGYRLAEMPFIGTRHMYRRQGMCRRLLDAIESTLSSIGVEELVIPAIPELLQTWTKVFGFLPIEKSKKEAMKCVNMVVFPGVDMLHKPLLHNQDSNPSESSVDKVVECTLEPKDEIATEIETTTDNNQKLVDAIDSEEATLVKDSCILDKSEISKFKTTPLNASNDDKVATDPINHEQTKDTEEDANMITRDTIEEQEEETNVSNATIYKEKKPANEDKGATDPINHEQTKDTEEDANVITRDTVEEQAEESNVLNAIIYEEKEPANEDKVATDLIIHEQTKDAEEDANMITRDTIEEQAEESNVLKAIVYEEKKPANEDKVATDPVNHQQTNVAEEDANMITRDTIEEQAQESNVLNATIYKEKKPADVAVIEKDDILIDGCSYPGTTSVNTINHEGKNASSDNEKTKETIVSIDDDELNTSDGANNLCDLNFPLENVQTSVVCDINVVEIIEDEQLPPSGVENDDISEVKASQLTSKLVLKNTFDLNLHPSGVDTDMHHIVNDDCVATETQVCIKSFELSDSIQ